MNLMRSFRLAAVFLCASGPVFGQLEVRLTAVSAPAPRALALPAFAASAAPSLTAAAPAAPIVAPALLPAAPLAAAPLIAAPAALPPVQARAAVLTGALAEFAGTDLKAASAGEAHGAGETLMLKALGGDAAAPSAVYAAPLDAPAPPLAPAEPAARPAERRTYLLSHPLRETVSLGPVALVAHIGYALGWEVLKAWLGWRATGSPMGALAVLAVELPFSPAMMTGRSLLDLGQRYWRRKLAVLREIARTPGVERVRVLTTGEARFWGPFARRKDNNGLIFVESSLGLPETVGRFGAPIDVADAASRSVRMTLVQDGETVAEWTPALKDLLDGRPIPAAVAAAWREALKGSRPSTPVSAVVSLSKGKGLSVEASLLDGEGGERPLGAVAYGDSVRSLIGLSRLDRARAWLGLDRPERSIHLSDSAVERPGAARAPEAWWSRAWRRASGRLIVASEAP